MKKICIVLLLALNTIHLFAEEQRTEKESEPEQAFLERDNHFFRKPYAKFIIPAVFLSYGLVAQRDGPFEQFNYYVDNGVVTHIDRKYQVDDYIQFAPYVAIYALDFCGVKAKHNLLDRTINLASSFLIMTAVVRIMKMTIDSKRPDSSAINSFPSGHTATAFVGAHVLYKEYRDVSPWIGVGGYVTATTVAALRVVNRRHWVSDVVASAGIGILSTELGYLLLPVFHDLFGIKEKNMNISLAPVVGFNNYGVGLSYTF